MQKTYAKENGAVMPIFDINDSDGSELDWVFVQGHGEYTVHRSYYFNEDREKNVMESYTTMILFMTDELEQLATWRGGAGSVKKTKVGCPTSLPARMFSCFPPATTP